jgi:uncharacterized repeat protein (TIGR03803 family)
MPTLRAIGSTATILLSLAAVTSASAAAGPSSPKADAFQQWTRHRLPLGTESPLYTFLGIPYLANPTASVIADANGDLYGTAGQGGLLSAQCPGSCGGVFELTPSRSGYIESTLYTFQGKSDGGGPFANLYMDTKGVLYGTATYAGSTNCGIYYGCGTVFKLKPFRSSYAESTIYVFQGGTDGASPTGELIGDASGVLYGTTQQGGNSSNDGTVFELIPKGKGFKENVIYRFNTCVGSGSCDGSNPNGGLYMDSSGALYGTAQYGGNYQCPLNNRCGTVFKLSPEGKRYRYETIYNFRGGSDGANPQGYSLIADARGDLYGATGLGGGATGPDCSDASIVRGCGTVFKLTRKGNRYTESVLYAFQGKPDAAAPQAGVIADASGALYGTTQLGGTADGGTIYKLMPEGKHYQESLLYSFQGYGDGNAPRAGLIEQNGTLYGTTFQGGSPACSCGIVFQFVP